MAQIKSAKKRIRRTVRQTAVNRDRTSRVRTFVKKVEVAIAGGDKAVAEAALHAAEPELIRGASKGIMLKNTASRNVSRLSKRVNAM